ncbi:MAG: aminomethyl transferase family protein [Acidobacteria bacterium]|nr:aminomethyl transferase family protein [Acidobacteriota bacterium]
MPRSPLFSLLEAAGAQFITEGGYQIPSSFGAVEEEHRALKSGVGLMDLSHRSRILVRGEDAARFLHGMVSNDVKGLEPGRGNHSFLLNVHGHILADLRVLRLDTNSFLLDCDSQRRETVWQALERHIVADAVELEDQTEPLACLALGGPCAREVLREVVGFDPPQMHFLDHIFVEAVSARLIRAALWGDEGYWILLPPDPAKLLWQKALQAGTSLDIRPVGFQAVEVCRIEAGVPRYGIDMDEKTLPQETGQTHAISFTKGCYIGQEVVERIRSRGHVNRRLMGLIFEEAPRIPAGAEILVNGRPAGTITNSVYSFRLRRSIALAYLRTVHAEPGTWATVGNDSAEVVELPFPVAWRN